MSIGTHACNQHCACPGRPASQGPSAFRQQDMSPRADRFSPGLKDADILSSTVPEKNEASMKGG